MTGAWGLRTERFRWGVLWGMCRSAGGLNSHNISRIPRKACRTVRAFESFCALRAHRSISVSRAPSTSGSPGEERSGSGPRRVPAQRSMAPAKLAMGELGWAWRTTGSLASRIDNASISARVAMSASAAELRACWRLHARACSMVSGGGGLRSPRSLCMGVGYSVQGAGAGRGKMVIVPRRSARIPRVGLG
jgi:hypothetical protein